MAQATLINKAGQKVVVESGSQDAKNYFGQGYSLMQAPKTTTSPTIPQSALTPANNAVKDISINKQLGTDKLTGFFTSPTFDPTVLDKMANKDFLSAVSLAAKGASSDAEILGLDQKSTVRDVLTKYNLGSLAPNFGIKGDTPAVTDTQGKTKENPVLSAYDQLISQKTGELGQTLDINQYNQEKITANNELEKARQTIADKELIDNVKLDQMRGQPIMMSMIQNQQNKYTADQHIDNLMNAQDYNNKLILSKMAEGNFLEAMKINQDIADDNFEIQKLQIDRAKEQGRITEAEQARLDAENNYQRTLATSGYTYISDPKKLAGLKEEQLFRDPVNGKIYLKPVEKKETSIVTADGRQLLYDSQTGKVIKDLGAAPVSASGDSSITANARAAMVKSFMDAGNSFEAASAMVDTITGGGQTGEYRTDRHNNPTAMTVDVAKTLGLVEGVDYVPGDSFDGGVTARLLGDPMEVTIKGLNAAAQSPNKSAFYTQSGAQRWTHTAMSDDEWNKMSEGAKRDTVALMYQREGGNKLFKSNVDGYSDAVKTAAAKIATGEMSIDDSSIKPFEAKLRQYMQEYGIKTPLTPAQVKAIESSPQGKILSSTQSVLSGLEEYKDLVEKHGTEAYGPIKGKMASLWSDLATGWKEQKNLGAITGPDLDLALKAVPDATGVTNMWRRKDTITAAIDTAINAAKKNSIIAINGIVSKNKAFADSDYVNELQTQAGLSDAQLNAYKSKLVEGEVLIYNSESGKIEAATPEELKNPKYIKINF